MILKATQVMNQIEKIKYQIFNLMEEHHQMKYKIILKKNKSPTTICYIKFNESENVMITVFNKIW